MKKTPLEPLIPLDQFGKMVAQIAQVPKDAVTARKARPKPKRKRAARKPS
jgi:hypothetical protein